MAIPLNRLATSFIDEEYNPPEERWRPTLREDYEGGPIGHVDTSGGMNYQPWTLSYVNNDIIVTPETVGSPVTVATIANCGQISFCFDQNARISLTYTVGNNAFLYWYDSFVSMFVTTEYTGVRSSMLALDDKRPMQVGANDMLLFYTKETSPSVFTLYHRKQRDRFQNEYTMQTNVLPFLSKLGMHEGLRVKVALRAGVG